MGGGFTPLIQNILAVVCGAISIEYRSEETIILGIVEDHIVTTLYSYILKLYCIVTIFVDNLKKPQFPIYRAFLWISELVEEKENTKMPFILLLQMVILM